MFITQCIPTVHIKYYSGHKNNSKQYMQGPWASRHTYSRGTEKNSALEDVQGCSEIQRQKIKQNDGTESLEKVASRGRADSLGQALAFDARASKCNIHVNPGGGRCWPKAGSSGIG